LNTYDEYVSLEATGKARGMAERWWQQRYAGDVPTTVDQALAQVAGLKIPRRLHVHTNARYPRIQGVEF
jgi:hypothetical protein